MQILVTGGAGLSGSFIVRELQARGEQPRILARPDSAGAAAQLGAEVALGDLGDAESLRRAADGADAIVHAACTFSADPAVDIAAMETLLDAWGPGPFVFISSLDVYGFARYTPVDERHPVDQQFHGYGRGKVHCERLLIERAARRGRADYSILRAPHIWGPHPRCCVRLIERELSDDRPVVLPGATEQEWSQYGDAWVDTRDLAWVVAECLRRPLGAAANVLDGHFTWHDLYADLIALTGSRSQLSHKPLDAIADDPYAPLCAQRWRYSGELLRQRLGFAPARRLYDTLAEVVALWRAGRGEEER